MKFLASFAALISSTLVAGNPMAVAAPDTTGPPESCIFKPTQTITATTGCPTICSSVTQCTADAAVELECGCTRMAVSPVTTTVCPTTTGCLQCTTGWGIAVITPTGCTTEDPRQIFVGASPTATAD